MIVLTRSSQSLAPIAAGQPLVRRSTRARYLRRAQTHAVGLLAIMHVACGDSVAMDQTPGDAGAGMGGDASVAASGTGGTGEGGAGEGGASPCVDVGSNPDHCGYCGHSCDGATCQDGICTPITYIGDEVGGQGIAIDDTHVYWPSLNNVVRRCPKAGCDQRPDIVVASAGGPTSVAIVQDMVLWPGTATGTIESCPVAGCTGSATRLGTGFETPTSLKVNASAFFFSSFDSGDLITCPLSGCAGAPTTLASGTTALGMVATDDTLFFTDRQANTVSACALPECAGGPAVLATAQSGAIGITYHEGWLYWVNQTGGEVRRCAADDCTGSMETIVANQPNPTDIVVDPDGVHWANYGMVLGAGSVATCPHDGCPDGEPLWLALSQMHPVALTSDATRVYWINVGNPNQNFVSGGVYAVPK